MGAIKYMVLGLVILIAEDSWGLEDFNNTSTGIFLGGGEGGILPLLKIVFAP